MSQQTYPDISIPATLEKLRQVSGNMDVRCNGSKADQRRQLAAQCRKLKIEPVTIAELRSL